MSISKTTGHTITALLSTVSVAATATTGVLNSANVASQVLLDNTTTWAQQSRTENAFKRSDITTNAELNYARQATETAEQLANWLGQPFNKATAFAENLAKAKQITQSISQPISQ